MYFKNLLNPQIPTHYPLIYSCLGSTRALSAVTDYKLHEQQPQFSYEYVGLLLYASNAQCQHESGQGAGGRAKVKVCCLRLCLIISVVTLKMHKCCLNAIQEMQAAKIEILLPCHVLQLLCNFSALLQSMWAYSLAWRWGDRAHNLYPACAWRYDRHALGQAMSLPCLKGGHDRQIQSESERERVRGGVGGGQKGTVALPLLIVVLLICVFT